MKTINKLASIILLLPLLLSACVREVWPENGGDPDEWVIPFGTAPSPDIVVSTKGTLGIMQESKVRNMYVFIFDGNKNKIFGKFFDESIKGADKKGVVPDWWTCSTDADGVTEGTIHVKAPQEDNCTIVAICNLNAEMMNVSPEYFATVNSYATLKNMIVTLNQEIYSRNGYFLMCGEITSGVNFASGTPVDVDDDTSLNQNSIPLGTMTLERLDAKIQFKVKAERYKLDANGSPVLDDMTGIVNFTPMSWQVVNLPKSSYIFPHGDDDDADGGFFNTEEITFETEELTGVKYCDGQREICEHGFSFYMLENRQKPTSSPGTWEYKHRELENGPDFQYAPASATYVILKGRLEIQEGAKTKTADVRYTIHLGDFGSSTRGYTFNQFSIERNNSYTYNISIMGVNHISVEVETGIENEPGAEGDILISTGETITCDSHYSTHSITFYQNNIDAEHMNWWVQTPFNPDGADPKSISLSAIDYEWVEFRVNKDKMSGGKYTENAWTDYRPRTGDHADPDNPTMTLPELMQYLQDPSHFDSEGKLVVTAFVNEFYYEKHPLTGQYEATLWERFVNQPMRRMCILSKVSASADGKSHVIESSFTIQQESIQTVYNINNPDLNSAWGVEYFVDQREKLSNLKYWSTRIDSPFSTANKEYESRGNTDVDNGRKNSLIEWELMPAPGYDTYVGNDQVDWSTYLNLAGDDDTKALMKPDYAYIRYACMSRNRDNDGDGKIDLDEVRWYLAASNQLIDLFMGSYGIESPAALYQRTPEERANTETGDNNNAVWREHVLASNRIIQNEKYKLDGVEGNYPANSNTAVRVVRAEEALAGSWYSRSNNRYNLTARCVRNLGYDPDTRRDITYSDETVVPDDLIVIKQYLNGQEVHDEWTDPNKYNNIYFEVDCSRLNEKSLRYFTDTDLPKHNEHSEAACLYRRFRTTSINQSRTFSSVSAKTMNETVDNGSNPYCPDGYRLPNIREIGILCYYPDQNVAQLYVRGNGAASTSTMARTYYSYGMEGDKKIANQWGWAIGSQGEFKAWMVEDDKTGHKTPSIRCVKDIR